MTAKQMAAWVAARPLLTKQDIAIRCAVTVRTVERWAAEGVLPRAIRIHGPRWRPEQIDIFERKRQQ